jgi:hypothetical protein
MRWLVVAAVAGCSGSASAPPPKPVPMDAAPRPLGPIPLDQTVGVRTDDQRRPPPANRPGRPIDVILRSTPQLAQAAVDGVPLGPTPAYWSGMADGHEHEFTFVLPGHAVARYRFVPITSGVIHARLDPIGDDQTDAGVADPPPGIPELAPVAPPATVITPDAPPAPIDAAATPTYDPYGPRP